MEVCRVRYMYRVRFADEPDLDDRSDWSAIVQAGSSAGAEAMFRGHHVADGGRPDGPDVEVRSVDEVSSDEGLLFVEQS